MVSLPTTKCTGCSVCRDVCPKSAIAMEYDKAGFIRPVINCELCVECGLCEKKCPVNNATNTSKPYLKTYAGYTADENILSGTTSGGFATELSRLIIGKGGVVAGVKYAKDFIKAEYSIATTEDELESFKGSKFVQSEKNGIYIEIKRLLRDGRMVLFVGCPCDVTGLISYLGDTNTENLLTCELVCMGVSSPKIAEDFIKYIQSKYKSEVSYLCSRSKQNGWFVPTLKVKFASGKEFTQPFYASYYGRGVQIYNRPSCFKCDLRGTKGMGDIRIGDFWGIKKTDPFWNKNGVSCIFVRTKKGLEYIDKLKKEGFKFFEVDYKQATENNMSSTENKGEFYEALCDKFSQIFLSSGLIQACEATADTTYKLKRIIPLKFQPLIKRIYHLLRDK